MKPFPSEGTDFNLPPGCCPGDEDGPEPVDCDRIADELAARERERYARELELKLLTADFPDGHG